MAMRVVREEPAGEEGGCCCGDEQNGGGHGCGRRASEAAAVDDERARGDGLERRAAEGCRGERHVGCEPLAGRALAEVGVETRCVELGELGVQARRDGLTGFQTVVWRRELEHRYWFRR